jgi:hypothetical protein
MVDFCFFQFAGGKNAQPQLKQNTAKFLCSQSSQTSVAVYNPAAL